MDSLVPYFSHIVCQRDGTEHELLFDLEDVYLVRKYAVGVVRQGDGSFYATICVDGKQWLLHRYLLQAPEGTEVDHQNENKLDNRRFNLRGGTKSQNQLNRKAANKNSQSGIKGITWEPRIKRWHVELQINKHRYRLGDFLDLEEAKSLLDEFRRQHIKSPD